MIRKKENFFLKLLRVLYPAVLYLGAQVFVAIAFTVGLTVFEFVGLFSKYGVTALDSLDDNFIYGILDKVTNNLMLVTFISALLIFPFFLWVFRKNSDERIDKYGLRDMGFSYTALIFAAAIPINTLSGFAVSLFKLEELSDSYPMLEEVLKNSPFIPMFLATVVAAPVIEELIFRGLIFNRINRYMGKGAALVLSSLLFGIIHMNIVQGTYAFFVGLLLGYLYLKYKTLWAPIIAHVGFNLTSTLMLLILKNAGELPAAMLTGTSLLISLPVIVLLFKIDFVPKHERLKIR